MTNKEIAQQFSLLASLMELHGESDYKMKAYQNAYISLRKVEGELQTMTLAELKSIKGVGDAIALKIQELQQRQSMNIIERYKEQTPAGLVDLLEVKGLGAKKLRTLWQELHLENAGELLYACNENRLVTLKGFGQKTQQNIQEALQYFMQSKNKIRYATLEPLAEALLQQCKALLPNAAIYWTGEYRRALPILTQLDILIVSDDIQTLLDKELFQLIEKQTTLSAGSIKNTYKVTNSTIPVTIILHQTTLSNVSKALFDTTGTKEYVEQFLQKYYPNKTSQDFANWTEEDIYQNANLSTCPPECREIFVETDKLNVSLLIENKNIKGMLHLHTSYSDGSTKLKELAQYIKANGYDYMGLTDHSQSAVYANGLKPARLLEQWAEVDELNKKLAPFRIYKGIESDILVNGNLDYEEDILKQFDFVIASVHSQLKMDIEKATQRLLKAIENPYTTILGHPTGRLLLAREGYPIDHKAIIDACAKHRVAIELNANPYRLDIDYQWIQYAQEKGVLIAINPDAHSITGLDDMRFGLLAARKGLLLQQNCLNTFTREQFEQFCS